MTYEAGWLERRITEAAQEHDRLPENFHEALKLETSSTREAAHDEPSRANDD